MTTSVNITVADVHYEPDCSPEQLIQVLSAMDRWSGMTGQHIIQQRTSDRHHYRTTLSIERVNAAAKQSGPRRQVFHVAARNVSKSGLGFIAPPAFLPRMLSEETPLLRTDAIFLPGTPVTVNLGPVAGKIPPISGVITRVRPVQLGFFEIGVKFVSRDASAPNSA